MYQKILDRISNQKTLNIVFALLAILNLHYLYQFAINTPWMDDWEAVAPGALSSSVNWRWVFLPHNEHRIVFTNFLCWAQYLIDGLNYTHTMYANFLLYLGIVYLIRECFFENFWQKFLFTIFALSTLSIENHTWAFQNQFHFFILFFTGALLTSKYVGKYWWVSPLFAIAGIGSFSCGVVCAGIMTVVWGVQAFLDRATVRLQVGRILLGSAAILLWLLNFQPIAGHPPSFMPWTQEFLAYYPNIISLAFGYDHARSIIPGLILILLLTTELIRQIRAEFGTRRFNETVLIYAMAIAGFACLALITVSRAGFGVWQSKSSRYAEVGILILPLALRMFDRYANLGLKRNLRIVVTLGLLIPLVDNFKFRRAYRESFEDKKQSQICIEQYYRGENKGDCPGYIANIADRLNNAKTLNMSFTRAQ